MAFPPTFTSFICWLCGGLVRLSQNTKHESDVSPGVYVQVPDDLELPQCNGCGEVYLDQEFSARVQASIGAVRMTPPAVPRCISGQVTCARVGLGAECPPGACLNTPEPIS